MEIREKLTAIRDRLMSQKSHSKYQRLQMETYIPFLRNAALALENKQMPNWQRLELEEKLKEGIKGKAPNFHVSPTWKMCCIEFERFLSKLPYRKEN